MRAPPVGFVWFFHEAVKGCRSSNIFSSISSIFTLYPFFFCPPEENILWFMTTIVAVWFDLLSDVIYHLAANRRRTVFCLCVRSSLKTWERIKTLNKVSLSVQPARLTVSKKLSFHILFDPLEVNLSNLTVTLLIFLYLKVHPTFFFFLERVKIQW